MQHRAVAKADQLGLQGGELLDRLPVQARVSSEAGGRLVQAVRRRQHVHIYQHIVGDKHAVALTPERQVIRGESRRLDGTEILDRVTLAAVAYNMSMHTPTTSGAIQAALATIAQDAALCEEGGFARRAAARDALELHVIDRIDALPAPSPELAALRQVAMGLLRRLDAADEALFARLRAAIRAGHLAGPALLAAITAYAGDDAAATRGYASLDVFINGLLAICAVPAPTRELAPEMVYYQKTPARVMLQLMRRAALTESDVLYDLGSGLGHVPILAGLLTPAAARGVELEPAYCAYAQERAAELGLTRVSFVNADAREAELDDGTVFFMYTPFAGHILQAVLGRLRALAGRRALRLFTFGPCTVPVGREPWLTRVGGTGAAELAEFWSRQGA